MNLHQPLSLCFLICRMGSIIIPTSEGYSEKAMATHSSTLAWRSRGWRSLEGCSPWGRWGSDTTKWLHFHFSLSPIGEGSGNPLQCSCQENPRDGGALWAAVYGIAQSRTRLIWLSSSSSSSTFSLPQASPFPPPPNYTVCTQRWQN